MTFESKLFQSCFQDGYLLIYIQEDLSKVCLEGLPFFEQFLAVGRTGCLESPEQEEQEDTLIGQAQGIRLTGQQ